MAYNLIKETTQRDDDDDHLKDERTNHSENTQTVKRERSVLCLSDDTSNEKTKRSKGEEKLNNDTTQNDTELEIFLTPQQQQDRKLVSGEPIIHQLLQVTNLFFQLDLQSILALTLTSKAIFKPLITLISNHTTFYYNKYRVLNFYHPQKLVIKTNNIKELSLIPFLDNLHEITFYDQFRSRTNNLPHSITHLEFGFCFNQPVDNILPPNITHLTFKGHFNRQIDNLPQSITHLKFGVFFGLYFNRIVNRLKLPQNLTHLEFGAHFKEFIKSLPPKVQQVTFDEKYKQPIDHLNKQIQFKKKKFDVTAHTYVFSPYQYNPN